jgi:hypothetical protein
VIAPEAARYLQDQILAHVDRFFTPAALQALKATPLHWLPWSEAVAVRGPAIAVPTDVAAPVTPVHLDPISFNGTRLTFWNPLPPPAEPGWSPFPDERAPLWYRHDSGTLIPAWNLAATLLDLLTLREEREQPERDRHGRCVAARSPRAALGLLEAPVFNDAVAALVAACAGLQQGGRPGLRLGPDWLKPPVLVLSHDLDQLRGNDVWTQAVRLFRVIRPLLKGRPPALRLLGLVAYNAVNPRRYYFDNVIGMITVERMLGFTSTFYFLNGQGGRFGARSGSELIPAAASRIPAGWDVGIHYNYDTHLAAGAFTAQREELTALCTRPITAGRAHYLRFAPEASWAFWHGQGITTDESLGYPDRVGYRAGIAGPFHPYDPETAQALPMLEMPLVVMDTTLIEQYPDDPVGAFRRLLGHIGRVGGAVSLLFHPGVFHNPEEPQAMHLYRRLLAVARDLNAQSRTAASFHTNQS